MHHVAFSGPIEAIGLSGYHLSPFIPQARFAHTAHADRTNVDRWGMEMLKHGTRVYGRAGVLIEERPIARFVPGEMYSDLHAVLLM